MMKISFKQNYSLRTNPEQQVGFGGDREIVHSLKKAMVSAESLAENTAVALHSMGRLHAYVDTATFDEAFPDFIENFRKPEMEDSMKALKKQASSAVKNEGFNLFSANLIEKADSVRQGLGEKCKIFLKALLS